MDMNTAGGYNGLIAKYADCLPLADNIVPVSLSEGNTPLIHLRNLPEKFGLPEATYVKFEGMNPTGSFKDRGMTVAVTQAIAEGREAIICASTGNTSASAASYAARAGIRAFVLIPDGKIAAGKMAQAIIKGAVIIRIRGNFDQGMQIVRDLAPGMKLGIVNSVNPYRLQGQKTAALEIVEALGRAPDYHCLPVGNAGNISAYWMGYSEVAGQPGFCTQSAQSLLPLYRMAAKRENKTPKMLGYQAKGAAPIVDGAAVAKPETLATAIRIGNPQSWAMATAAAKESGGWFRACSDEEIIEMQQALAESEGIFCEPASAISLAGLRKDVRDGKIPPDAVVTCTLTGHGMKDPDIVSRIRPLSAETVSPEQDAVRAVIAGHL